MDETLRGRLNGYVRELFAPEDDVLRDIMDEAQKEDIPTWSVRQEEGRMLQFLVSTVGAKKVVEIGTLAGYSGTWLARALPSDGKLYTLEGEPKHADFARRAFEKAGLGERVEVRLGDAHETLSSLNGEGPFDAVFIDAEKAGYPHYLEWALDNVRPGGLILGHNAFWSGRVIDPAFDDNEGAQGLRAFMQRMATDERLLATVIPVGDGIAAAVVRG